MVPHTCHPWFKVILGYILNSSSAGSPAWYFASEIETPNKQKPTEQVIGYLKDFFYYIYLFYVRVHGGQVTVWGNLFFPSTTWVPRIKLRLGSKCLNLLSFLASPSRDNFLKKFMYMQTWVLPHNLIINMRPPFRPVLQLMGTFFLS